MKMVVKLDKKGDICDFDISAMEQHSPKKNEYIVDTELFDSINKHFEWFIGLLVRLNILTMSDEIKGTASKIAINCSLQRYSPKISRPRAKRCQSILKRTKKTKVRKQGRKRI